MPGVSFVSARFRLHDALPCAIDFDDAGEKPLTRFGKQPFGRRRAPRYIVDRRLQGGGFGQMLLRPAGRFALHARALGFRGGKCCLQVFDPGGCVGQGPLLFGHGTRQGCVFGGLGREVFLQLIEVRAQLALRIFGRFRGLCLRNRRVPLFWRVPLF